MSASCKLVSLVKGPDSYANIKKALELVRPDLGQIRDKKRILIKPNLTATKNKFANTQVSTVKAILDFLLENFSELKKSQFTILEGSGSAYYEHRHTKEVLKDFGYLELEHEYKNVKLECVEDFPEFQEIEIKSIAGPEKLKVVKHFLDFDYRISVAIPKSHNYAIATFGIKNMAGLIRQEDKSLLHGLRTPSAPKSKTIFTYVPTSVIARMRRRFPGLVNMLFKQSLAYLKATKVIHHNVAELAKLTYPDLVVLDGFNCMDGNGPVDGFPVELGVAVASTDPLKADGVGARLMGLEPQDIGYLYYLYQEGWGDYSLDGLAGENINSVKKNFKLHPTYRIQQNWKER